MYKVTYKAGKGNLEILSVEKIKNHTWLEETDQEKIEQIRKNFYTDRNIYWIDLDGEATGIAVYNSKFKYITGHLLKIKRDKDMKLAVATPLILAADNGASVVQPMAIIFILVMIGFILWVLDKSKK